MGVQRNTFGFVCRAEVYLNVKNLRLCNKCLLIADGSDSVCLPQRGKVAQPIFILVVTDEVWCKIILHFCYAK